jgi:adenylate cyclase
MLGKVGKKWLFFHNNAIEAADLAIKYDPDEPWTYIGLVFISVITQDGEKLLSSALRAVELNPNFALAHSFVGCAHACVGRGSESFDWIAKARRLSPRDIFREEFDLHSSFAHFQVGNYEDAAVCAAWASMPRPEHVYPYLIAAASHAHLNKIEPALGGISRVQRIVPECSIAFVEKACVFLVQDDIARFIEGLRKAGLPERAGE